MEEKRDYQSAVLDILKKHINEDVSRTEIMQKTNISKSRLSEVLLSIKANGYVIVTPPRSGIVRLEEKSSCEVLSPIKDSDIRQWLILFLLSKYEKLSFNELLIKTIALRDYNIDQMRVLIDSDNPSKHYDNANLIKNLRKNLLDASENGDVAKDIASVTVLRQDLSKLCKEKLVACEKGKHTKYRLSNAAPYIIPLSGDSLYEFCQRYEESASSATDSVLLKQTYAKITNLINLEGKDSDQHRFGRINDITQEQIDSFNIFIQSGYKSNLIQLDYEARGRKNTYIFSVGLLFYSPDTSFFYALGKNITTGYTTSLRLDRMSNVTTLDEPSDQYHQQCYYNILEEMFSAAYEDNVYHVKVLFQRFSNVHKRFYDLCQVRKNAIIREIDNKPDDCIYDYIYEDTIRGISSFERYLRSFGFSVLALEPPKLKQDMIETYTKIAANYEDNDEFK
ncbi:WYL domain-containing protein [Butyrivibrio sp. AE3009]|uniref:WYL domain-containing protein n=1 Tax=Butyrivibrio sp. AE3009 TaxID=1280666 RepID=UPI0003B6EABE|nr:WYL domain-containing protein [Butyrivibrio sp. AE3009]